MRFIPLDLENFTAISQQVDDVISKFKELAAQGPDAVDELRTAIEQRLMDLESFYYNNDLDERAILFEKQRLKLRKLLRDYDNDELSLGQPEAPPATKSSINLRSRPPQQTSVRRTKENKSDPTLVRSSAVKEKKLRVAPIYDWELRQNDRSRSGPEDSKPPPPEGFEFQVKLSREEFETLMERRSTQAARGRSFLHKGQGKTMSSVIKRPLNEEEGAEGQYVTSQGPYIEPSYFDNWRDTDKGKWVAKSDFKRTGLDERQPGPFDKKLQLDNFLHQGPYVENSSKAVLRAEDKNKWVADGPFRRHC